MIILLLVGAFGELAFVEAGSGSYQRHEVGCVDCSPAVLGRFDEFERHRDAETIGFRNVIIRWPERRMAIVLLSNRNHPEPRGTVLRIADALISAR